MLLSMMSKDNGKTVTISDDVVETNDENYMEKKHIRFRNFEKHENNHEPRIENLDLEPPENLPKKSQNIDKKGVSIFDFVKTELTRGYQLEHDEERFSARREKIYSYMKIPREVERFMSYGFFQCVDSFLFVYTFLPIRFLMALWAIITRPLKYCLSGKNEGQQKGERFLRPAEMCDLLKGCVVLGCWAATCKVDTSMMYHLVKSQSVIKLYIFYNMLEVGDRLLSAFGQDTIDALLWTATEPRSNIHSKHRQHLGTIPHLLFALTYVLLHSILVLLQATTLNVAINSSNKALLTIMMSNNFVELKGSVFKKFDKNNLFQLSCADVRERFHLMMLLLAVILQTMKEYAWKADRLAVLLPDCVYLLIAEVMVDWVKHAFITRFNELRLTVYRDYTVSLAYDMAQTRQKTAFSDPSDLVARRMGFIPLPLSVAMGRVLCTTLTPSAKPANLILFFLGYLILVALRVLNSLVMLGKACDLISSHSERNEVKLRKTSSTTFHRTNSVIIDPKDPNCGDTEGRTIWPPTDLWGTVGSLNLQFTAADELSKILRVKSKQVRKSVQFGIVRYYYGADEIFFFFSQFSLRPSTVKTNIFLSTKYFFEMESFLALFDTGETMNKRKASWDGKYKEKGSSECGSSGNDDDHEGNLPPEPEQGNVEYKLKLVNPSSQRFEHLVTQMKWRLREGHGEAIYQIGVEDNGRLAGLSREDMKASLKTLRDMASRLGATTRVLRERIANSSSKSKSKKKHSDENLSEKRRAVEVLVTKLRKGDQEDQDSVIDLRLAVVGSQDAGKSTLLGVLTQGGLDNGRGRARLNMLRHLHEIRTGRTSSISHEIIGFDTEGHVLNYAEMTTAEEICDHASKVVTFIDLAGHRKYLRTTLLGLMGYSPHHVMVVVAPPLNEAAQEHMAICLALRLPFFIVVTKIDLNIGEPNQTLLQLENAVRSQGCDKELILCNDNKLPDDYEENIIPVFAVSSVTGAGLENLTGFIRDLSPSESSTSETGPGSCLFRIDETFRVAGLSDPVLGGLLVKGAIAPGTRLLVGPLPDGEFSPVKVVSLHRNKAPCGLVRASQSASLTIAPSTKRDGALPHMRPGMVLVSIGDHPHATVFFQATVLVVYHATSIYPGFQATVHVGNVRQTCVMEGIMDVKDGGLQTNDTASVLFRFVSHPEYLHVGMRLLFREGRTKGIGKITQVFPLIGSDSNSE